MQLGASFSHPHLKFLGIDPLEAIKEFNKLGLKWIRLGSYWSESEKTEGKYSFSNLDPLVEFCEKNNIKVVLTVGMKAFRWPEYYFLNGWKNKLVIESFQKYLQETNYFQKSYTNTLKKWLFIFAATLQLRCGKSKTSR